MEFRTDMLQYVLQTGIDKIAQDIWEVLKTHPREAVAIFLVIFIGFILFFTFVVKKMSPYIAILCFVVAGVLTPLILLALFTEVSTTATIITLVSNVLKTFNII